MKRSVVIVRKMICFSLILSRKKNISRTIECAYLCLIGLYTLKITKASTNLSEENAKPSKLKVNAMFVEIIIKYQTDYAQELRCKITILRGSLKCGCTWCSDPRSTKFLTELSFDLQFWQRGITLPHYNQIFH